MPGLMSEFGQAAARMRCILTKNQILGLPGYFEAGSATAPGFGMYNLQDQCKFESTTGPTWLVDVTPTQDANLVLVPANLCPPGLRPYITRATVISLGDIPWSNTSPSGIPYVSIQGTDGSPLIHIPFTALPSQAGYSLPASGVPFGLLLGEAVSQNTIATFTYNATTGVITASASVFVSAKLIGAPVQIIDGTGKASSGIVAANTAATLTLEKPFNVAPADHASSAKDSIIEVFYQNLSAYTDTTHVTLENGGGTPFTASALDSLYISPVAGAGLVAGALMPTRKVIANTNAGALTLDQALSTAMNTTTTAVALSSNPAMAGIVDMTARKQAAAAINTGIQVKVANLSGTTPLGSPLRISIEGFWAA